MYQFEIADGLERIGNRAFAGCSKLKSVELPDSITDMGAVTFSGCSSLPSIELPENLTSLESDIFAYCSSLTKLSIPAGVTSIDGDAFVDCTSLKTITVAAKNAYFSSQSGVLYNKDKTELLKCPMAKTGDVIVPDGVTKLAEGAFIHCEYITRVELPDSVTSIGRFNHCYKLESITIPEGVTSIIKYGFEACKSLGRVELPKSMTDIGEGAFKGATNAVFYCYKDSAAPTYAEKHNIPCFWVDVKTQAEGTCGNNLKWVLENVNKTGVLKITGTGAMNDYDPLNYKNEEEPNASPWYAYRELIEKVTMENGITYIGTYAFYGCGNAVSITVPKSVTEMGPCAFADCESLKTMTIPNGVTQLNMELFKNCQSLTSVSIPKNVEGIYNGVFYNCSSLESIELPKKLWRLGEVAFYGCSSLKSIKIPDLGTKCIERQTFKGCTSLTSVELPASIKSIESEAFRNCTSLKSIKIPSGVDAIENYVFQDCTSLKTVDIRGLKNTIKDNAFDGCKNVVIQCYPNSEAYTYAVKNKVAYKIRSISIEKTKIELAATKFIYSGKAKKPTPTITFNDKKLVKGTDYTVKYSKNINIGTGYVVITGKGNYTGSVKKSFKIAVEKGKIYTIDAYKYKITSSSTVAFAGISSSKTIKVTIPKTVKIGGKDFKVTSIATRALYKKTKVTSVTIGTNVTSIGKEAFRNCNKLSSITIKSTKLKSVGANAFKGIKSSAKIKVPSKKLSSYKKLLKRKGQSSTVKIAR